MDYIITVKGNQLKGYTAKLQLPVEWLSQFSRFLGKSIGGSTLCHSWGNHNPNDKERNYVAIDEWDVEKAKAHVSRWKEEIRAANKFLEEVRDVDMEFVGNLRMV